MVIDRFFVPFYLPLWWISLACLFLISESRPSEQENEGSGAYRKPTPYPVNFQVAFVTNVTDLENETAIGGRLYYDWSLKGQRVDHDAGAYECNHFYQTNDACSLYFLEQGMFRVLSDGSCCLDLAEVRTPPPTWARNVNSTFNGMVRDEHSGLFAYEWTFDHLDPPASRPMANFHYHTTREVALPQKDAGKPLVFTFPGKALGRQDYHYRISTLVEGPQDPILFELPTGCETVVCDGAEVSRH